MMESRRYLTNFSTARTANIITDVVVIGSGIAGLQAALAAAEYGEVVLLCKDRLAESNTWYAQGGIAIAPPGPDSVTAHVDDTLRVGCGLCDVEAVHAMVAASQPRLENLIRAGMKFDRDQDGYAYTTEGGHSSPRVLHAGGDSTGQALIAALEPRVRQHPSIRIFENCFAIDLLTADGRCLGVVTFHPHYGHQLLWARQTVLASGGCGRMYLETTNPPGATGDGPAMALRAGVVLQDMELMQFHPTTLYVAGATRALISEAVRGEGGKLVDEEGRRFMPQYHPQAELAPRDVVSRAILDHMVSTQARSVFLDVRHFEAGAFERRFPFIAGLCARFGVDPERDLIPVRPAAHYMIGGVAVDLEGRSSMEGLWACGEAAATGVHGANRLASNSLLEGLVWGARAGDSAGRLAAQDHIVPTVDLSSRLPVPEGLRIDLADLQNSLRSRMWRQVGIRRSGPPLQDTIHSLELWSRYLLTAVFDDPEGWQTQNMLTTAWLTTIAAQHRCESRGVHFRTDYPDTDDHHWRVHLTLQRTDDGIRVDQRPI